MPITTLFLAVDIYNFIANNISK